MEPIPNYFYINRALLESNRWLAEPFTRAQAWVDLIGLARHNDGYMRIRGIKIELKRGQVGRSQLTLAKRWRWSRKKVKRYLNELENDGDVTQQTTHQNSNVTTVITILRYNYWQGEGAPNDTPKGTAEEHQKNTKGYTNNNGNKEKKDNNDIYTKTFLRFFDAYPKKVEKKKAFIVWQRKGLKIKTDEIVQFVERARVSRQWQDGYVPNPSTFLNGERWNDDLSAYDTKKKNLNINLDNL